MIDISLNALRLAMQKIYSMRAYCCLVLSSIVATLAPLDGHDYFFGAAEDDSSTTRFIRDYGPPVVLPSSYDATSYFPSAGHQGSFNSCAGWAAGYAGLTYIMNRKYQQQVPAFSPLWIYNQITAGNNSYARVWNAFIAINDYGCDFISNFNPSSYAALPPSESSVYAYQWRGIAYDYIGASDTWRVEWVKYHMSLGRAVIVLLSVYPEWDRLASETPPVYDTYEFNNLLGRHYIALVGYDNATQRFKFINSHGTNFGANGFAYLPYSSITNKNLLSISLYWMGDARGALSNIIMQNMNIISPDARQYLCQTMVLGGGVSPAVVKIETGTSVDVQARETVRLLPGVNIRNGAQFRARIIPDLLVQGSNG